jgi:hypothetical protein
MGSVWSFAAIATIIDGAIIYQKPLSNILINLAQKAGQTPSSTTAAQQQQPFSGPIDNPNPSSPSPSPSTPSSPL